MIGEKIELEIIIEVRTEQLEKLKLEKPKFERVT